VISGLLEVLGEARYLGFLGPGPVDDHLRHARAFAEAATTSAARPPDVFADLGSGGGVPALVLLDTWPDTRAVLVEALGRRAEFLVGALARLHWSERVEVRAERAEVVAQEAVNRERFSLVTARSFGAPAVTAEIAAGLVTPGGRLVVSDPPEADPRRWPADRLAELGFGPAERIGVDGFHFVIIPKVAPTPPDRPRVVGRPGKRPLW